MTDPELAAVRALQIRRDAAIAECARSLRETHPDRWEQILADIQLQAGVLQPGYETYAGKISPDEDACRHHPSIELLHPQRFPIINSEARFPFRFKLERLQLGRSDNADLGGTLTIFWNGVSKACFPASIFRYGQRLDIWFYEYEQWSFVLSNDDRDIPAVSYAFSGFRFPL